MTIVLCGGGSGGHITPLLAVARELRSRSQAHKLIYIGEKNGKFSHIAEDSGLFDEYYYLSAGKLRRYHNEPLLKKLFDFKTIFLNIRDSFRLLKGCLQSIRLFKKLNPDAVLLKGGYVCVPAAIGASKTDALIITHDSDALPGLSNRFAARYAKYHATGMPAKYYSYPPESVREVGLPIDERFKPYSADEVRFLKEKYQVAPDAQLLLFTGGSLGAERLNKWALSAARQLLPAFPKLNIILIAGKGKTSLDGLSSLPSELAGRLNMIEFSSELFHLSAIADVIVTRAGATTIAEYGAAKKACILVPNPDLTGGHQLKNAQVYLDQDAVIVVNEKELTNSVEPLTKAIKELLNSPVRRQQLGENLYASLPSKPASAALADLLTERAK